MTPNPLLGSVPIGTRFFTHPLLNQSNHDGSFGPIRFGYKNADLDPANVADHDSQEARDLLVRYGIPVEENYLRVVQTVRTVDAKILQDSSTSLRVQRKYCSGAIRIWGISQVGPHVDHNCGRSSKPGLRCSASFKGNISKRMRDPQTYRL